MTNRIPAVPTIKRIFFDCANFNIELAASAFNHPLLIALLSVSPLRLLYPGLDYQRLTLVPGSSLKIQTLAESSQSM
jgi:hypothetical protein